MQNKLQGKHNLKVLVLNLPGTFLHRKAREPIGSVIPFAVTKLNDIQSAAEPQQSKRSVRAEADEWNLSRCPDDGGPSS